MCYISQVALGGWRESPFVVPWHTVSEGCIPSPNPLASIRDRREGPYPTATYSLQCMHTCGEAIVCSCSLHPNISGLVEYSKSVPFCSYQNTISYVVQSPHTYAAETYCSGLFNIAGMLLSPFLLLSCNTG